MRGGSLWRRAAAAAVLAAAFGLELGAQTYNAIGSGGPLWWFPENDGSYSRHHDRWSLSRVESLNGDWGTATSFPTNPRDTVWVSDVSGAPENTACDLQNGTERRNVGPPYPAGGVTDNRTARTPGGGCAGARGGCAGLQESLHIGEWWQGMKYLGYYNDPTAFAEHFSSRPAYDPALFGWFDVGMKDRGGTVQRPPLYRGGHSVTWINPAYSQWQLWGGGGFSMPCLGLSMVQMHGVEDGGSDKVWPPLPVGADGGECWSSARPLVIRVNSESRCEPNLRERYPYTVRFWTDFDARPPRPAPAWIGGSYGPLFPPDYIAPYPMARRGEVGIFTASELAAAEVPAVPWSPLTYPDPGVSIGTTRSAMPPRFLDPDRVDPFGGATYGAGTMEVYNSDLDATECLELGEPGWDRATGTLVVDCGHGRENSPNTGRVNRAAMAHGTAERSREVGPVDNSRAYGGTGLARRHAGLWAAPAGFGWFEHRNATLGCFFNEVEVDTELPDDAEASRQSWLAEVDAAYAAYLDARARLARCASTDDRCRSAALAAIAAARARGRRAFRIAYGWAVIRDYRRVVLPELFAAFSGASPYGYFAKGDRLVSAGGSRYYQTYVATGRVLGHGGNACVTNMGGGTYNEAVIASIPTRAPGVGFVAHSSIPGQGGPMWYGPAFEEYGAHPEGVEGGHFTQFADVVGRTTPYSEAVINPGSEYPEELRSYRDYNDVRLGSTVWRDFACKTAHTGYYGMGLEALGTSSFDHREYPDQAWLNPDPGVTLGDITATQFSSGTPCVGNAAYDAVGTDGTQRCWDPADGLGAYSSGAHPSGGAGSFKLGYSGDGSSDTGRSGSVDTMRPTSYRMINGSELLDLNLRTSFMHFWLGYRSIDVEREAIWSGYGPWGSANPYKSSWLRSGEAFEGLSPGWCAGSDSCDDAAAPMDWGRLEHQGQLRWYGAISPGGTGGCALAIGGEIDREGSVMETDQQIICLLPIDSIPDGKCPGENLP